MSFEDPLLNFTRPETQNKIKNWFYDLSRKIHNNPKTSNVANAVNNFLTPKNKQDESQLDNFANKYIDSGAISQSDYDTYINNLFTGDLDYQRNLEMMKESQAFNSAEAEKNRQWQTEMSNSAFTRQSQDLKNAGFNPAMALGGSGASVMSVNTPASTGSSSNLNNGITNMMSTAMSSNATMSSGIMNLVGKVLQVVLKKK